MNLALSKQIELFLKSFFRSKKAISHINLPSRLFEQKEARSKTQNANVKQ